METAVFHKIAKYPTDDKFTHSIEQVLSFNGVITFDGIYESVFDYRDLLKHRKPVLFVSGSQIGREGFCNYQQLMCMATLGFELAWHGWSHRRLTELSDAEVMAELYPLKEFAETGKYAYPHGDFDDRVIQLLKNAGFKKAYSTTQGEDGNEFTLRRVYV